MPSRSTLDAQSSHRSEEESQPIPQAQHRSRAPSLPLAPTRYQLTDWQCHSKPLSQRKLQGPVGGGAFWSAAARCAPHAILLHTVTVSRPPDTPFQRVMRVLHQQQQQTSCPCFRFLFPLHCSPMSSNTDTFWSDACRNARNRPLPTVLVALRASCGATVRRPPLLPLGACPAHVCAACCCPLSL